MDAENIQIHTEEGIGLITVNRPRVLNALNAKTLDHLSAVLQEFKSDPAVKVVIITGSGQKAFIAGADVQELMGMDPAAARNLARKGQDLFNTIERFTRPVIAAINGYCLGGGCELALACHLRVASTRALLGQPEVKLGVIPGYGGTQRLPRLVGRGIAMELLLTGKSISADEALRIGLVNQVVEPGRLLPACREMAAVILRNSPVAVRHCIEAVNKGLNMPMEQAMEMEAALFAICVGSGDMEEGIQAFLDKREPRFAIRKETDR